MKSGMVKWLVLLLFVVGVIVGAFYAGRKTYKPSVRWLSELTGKYPIDTEVTCNGSKKDLGRVVADMDLTNGKWRVVRNDPGKYPVCP